jgi:hypothetical protein
VLGKKLTLLGSFSGQGLGPAQELCIKRARVEQQQLLQAQELQEQREAQEALGAAAAPSSSSSSSSCPAALPALRSSWGAVQLQLRCSAGEEFVQLVIVGGRVVGALLIGDTDLEEALENLILNRLDVRDSSGEVMDLLRPDVDLEDFFD